MTRYRIGTRGSKLAIIQTRQVMDRLQQLMPDAIFDPVVISSRGDIHSDVPISALGQRGLFTAELERELLERRIDLAVHSAKDMPTESTEGLLIGAYCERIDPRETLISQNGWTLATLPKNALIGTSSPRRRFQLANLRSDLRFEEIRGNVDTRIQKVRNGPYQATVMAAAGLIRMGLLGQAAEIFSLDQMLPAAGQGALAVQCRHDDYHLLSLLQEINHEPTEQAVSAERAVLHILEAGCSCPIGVYAEVSKSQMILRASLYESGGTAIKHAESSGLSEKWGDLAKTVAERLRG